MPLRVLIVDDSQVTRRVLSALIGSRWTVCGEAPNGRAGVKRFRELKPDLVLLDLAMPDIDGIEAGRQMHAIDSSVPLILFTLLDPWGLASAAKKAGIDHVISKTQGTELMRCVEQLETQMRSPSRAHAAPPGATRNKRAKSAHAG